MPCGFIWGFTLSYRDVEELLAERGLDVSYEAIRRWVDKFGSTYARNLRRLRLRAADTWHLDEMVVSIQGRRMYLWRSFVRLVTESTKLGVRPCEGVFTRIEHHEAPVASSG
jgi:transposase-like protein